MENPLSRQSPSCPGSTVSSSVVFIHRHSPHGSTHQFFMLLTKPPPFGNESQGERGGGLAARTAGRRRMDRRHLGPEQQQACHVNLAMWFFFSFNLATKLFSLLHSNGNNNNISTPTQLNANPPVLPHDRVTFGASSLSRHTPEPRQPFACTHCSRSKDQARTKQGPSLIVSCAPFPVFA